LNLNNKNKCVIIGKYKPTGKKAGAESGIPMVSNTNFKIAVGNNCFLDLNFETLIRDNMVISLSRTQFRLLYYLVQHLGKPVKSEELIAYAWGEFSTSKLCDLYVYINRLRQRIGDDTAKPKFLLTIRNIGYILYPISD
jgi:DNA-binding response OmpR family regulator